MKQKLILKLLLLLFGILILLTISRLNVETGVVCNFSPYTLYAPLNDIKSDTLISNDMKINWILVNHVDFEWIDEKPTKCIKVRVYYIDFFLHYNINNREFRKVCMLKVIPMGEWE